MRRPNLIDVVITVEGGVVQGVAVDDASIPAVNIVLVDFDDIAGGGSAVTVIPSRLSAYPDCDGSTVSWAKPLLVGNGAGDPPSSPTQRP